MAYDYRNLLRVLWQEQSGGPVLFEPLVDPAICERLIWRRGPQLWDKPERYCDTLLSLRARLEADTVPLDLRRFDLARGACLLAYAAEAVPDTMRVVALCDSAQQQALAEGSACVCAVAGFGPQTGPDKKPFIRMDGTVSSAEQEGAAGYFVRSDVETLLCGRHDVALLGGLGLEWLNRSPPQEIYRRCDALFQSTGNRAFALGSGGLGEQTEYLPFISLLGAYIRSR